MSIRMHGIVQSNSCGEGNKMFQTFVCLIYAHKNNLRLLNTIQFKNVFVDYKLLNADKPDRKNLIKQNLSSSDFKNNELNFFGNDKLYWVTDFFQNADYLNANYDILKLYVHKINLEKYCFDFYDRVGENDILCILRLGVMKGSELVDPSYFTNIFDNHNFDKIYFLVYPSHDEDIEKYLDMLNLYRDKIVLINNNNPVLDFYCVNFFKHIALSISTYNWWSVYFCETIEEKCIYTPKYFGHCKNTTGKSRNHCINLSNIRNSTIPREHSFIKL